MCFDTTPAGGRNDMATAGHEAASGRRSRAIEMQVLF
jgi:hypothetical protein